MTKKNNADTEIEVTKFNEVRKIVVSKVGFASKFKTDGKQKKVLVIRDYQNAVEYAKTCEVIYVTDNSELAAKFNKEVGDELFGNNDKAILVNQKSWDSILSWFPILKDEEGNEVKFDVCIGNPPYKNGLHLKILQETVKHADNVVFIHPAKWLQFPTRERPSFLNGIIKDFTMIERSIANNTFGINDGDLVITEVCKDNGGYFSGTPVEDPKYPCFKFNSRFV